MKDSHRSIFREDAVRRYLEGREKSILPRLVSLFRRQRKVYLAATSFATHVYLSMVALGVTSDE